MTISGDAFLAAALEYDAEGNAWSESERKAGRNPCIAERFRDTDGVLVAVYASDPGARDIEIEVPQRDREEPTAIIYVAPDVALRLGERIVTEAKRALEKGN